MSIQLGDLVRDRISGLEGIVIGRTEWLYGCVRCLVQPRELKDGQPITPSTIDEPQLDLMEPKVVPNPVPEPRKAGPRDDLAAQTAMKVVYIAGPYRGASAWDIEENIRVAERLALEVWRAGAVGLCPHTNTRFFQGAAPDNVWLDGYLEVLARCDAVIMTADWERSTGAQAEHAFAVDQQIPIFYAMDRLHGWLRGE